MSRFGFKAVVTFLGLICLAYAPPPPTQKTPSASPVYEGNPTPPHETDMNPPDTGLYYDEYLQKVVKLLESDEKFRKAMESAKFEDIRDGKLSDQIYEIPRNIRKQLDEAKKEEINRLRKIAHAKLQLDQGQRIRNSNSLKEIANHLDSGNAHTFEAQDLTNLIKAATKDLENFDENRHKEFKKYEMNKEMRRQELLKKMNEEDRKKAEKEYQEMRKKHEDHPAMNHPGSKAQMEEVWDEEDGLKGQEFNPKTFFRLHDLNGDNSLDPMELEALFEKDLAKVYDSKNPEDDMMEMEEERRRMRQHVMKEVDYDKNGLIGFDEFMRYTDTEQFGKPDEKSYKTVDQMIDDDEIYTPEELNEFREMIAEQEKEVKDKLDELRKQAQNVVSLKSEIYKAEKVIGPNAPEHEKAELEEKKAHAQEQESILQEMHEDLKEQSKEITEMKQELKKQEDAQKIREGGEPEQVFDINDIHDPEKKAQFMKDGKEVPPQGGPQRHGSQQYQQPPQGGQQYQQPPQGGQQYQQPPQGSQQYQQPPQGGQQYQQPPQGGQQYQQPPQGGQQYQQPPQGGQQYQQPPQGNQQYQQPPQGGQQYQQPPQGGQQYQQPPQGGQQYQQPPQGGQPQDFADTGNMRDQQFQAQQMQHQ